MDDLNTMETQKAGGWDRVRWGPILLGISLAAVVAFFALGRLGQVAVVALIALFLLCGAFQWPLLPAAALGGFAADRRLKSSTARAKTR